MRGRIEASALGRTLVHEHVFVLTADSQAQWSDEWDEEAAVADAIRRLSELATAGIATIADPTVDGLGRDVRRIARIQAAVSLNILVATGIYTYDDAPFYFEFRRANRRRRDPMIDCFVRDLTEGVQGTAIRAAFLKCAIDRHGLTEGVERVLRAVAAAHRETGAPVMVHTDARPATIMSLRRLLAEEDVAPSRVLLAHLGDSDDVSFLAELAGAGFVLGMDRFGINWPLEEAARVRTVAELCRQGFARQLTLSHDAACYIDWVEPDYASRNPSWHYLHISDDVLPALRELGVGEKDLDEMLIGAPARFFAP